MTNDKPTAFGPLASTEDGDAMLYAGHLAAQAEIALPGAPREAQIALAWLSAHVASEGARVWNVTIRDIEISGSAIGSWKLTARTSRGKPRPVTLERKETLRQDGRQLTTLARTFESTDGGEQAGPGALESLLDFAVMSLFASSSRPHFKAVVTDLQGTRIEFNGRKIWTVKRFRQLFSYGFQYLVRFIGETAIFCF